MRKTEIDLHTTVKDWRTRDNIIICLNLINKNNIKNDFNSKLVRITDVYNKITDIAKKKKCKLYDASVIYKEELKNKLK